MLRGTSKLTLEPCDQDESDKPEMSSPKKKNRIKILASWDHLTVSRYTLALLLEAKVCRAFFLESKVCIFTFETVGNCFPETMQKALLLSFFFDFPKILHMFSS